MLSNQYSETFELQKLYKGDTIVNKIIFSSWNRCSDQGLCKHILSPKMHVSNEQFDTIYRNNELLIATFDHCISEIKEYLTGSFLFLLTDAQGVLLSLDCSKNIEKQITQLPIKLGMLFSEESCGTNAISLAMSINKSVYIQPEQHYCHIFKSWYCFSTPLIINKEVIGYLDVSTIDMEMRKELIAITKILPDHLLNSYKKRMKHTDIRSNSLNLTKRQIEIISLISQGHTGRSIATELRIKECTVNHHKKIIFDKLGVQSSTEAVSKALQLQLISSK